MINVFASVAAALLALASSVILLTASAWLITKAAFKPPLSELAIGITAVRAAGIGRAVFRYIERLCVHSTALNSLNAIRLKLYRFAIENIPVKPGAFLHDLTVRADVQKDFLPRVVVPLLCLIVLNVIATAIIFQSIGLIALLLPIALFLTAIISKTVEETEINDGDYRQTLLDFNDGRDEIAIADSFDRVQSILDKKADALSTNQNKIVNADSICALINAAALCVMLYELSARLDVIAFAVHLFLLLIVFENISTVPLAVRTWRKMHFVDDVKIKNASAETTDKAIEIKNLSFDYDGRTVLNDLSLTVNRADRIAIAGESGAGKTTLLFLLTGLLTPKKGTIAVGGSIAAATNSNYIFSGSIRENFLMLNPTVDEATMLDCLKLAQLEGFDLDGDIGLDGARLSGGQRCRLQTALALATRSDVLILDEPTAGLDRLMADRLIDALLTLPQTLIVITHDPIVAARFNTVYRLENGKFL